MKKVAPRSERARARRGQLSKHVAVGWYRVCRANELKPGESRKFLLPVGGVAEECFVVNFRGAFHAYVNRCRHVPMAMDWVDNQFFSERGRYLMCATHGAYYEPASGECVAGPPTACGKLLFRVPLELEGGEIFARPPQHPIQESIESAALRRR